MRVFELLYFVLKYFISIIFFLNFRYPDANLTYLFKMVVSKQFPRGQRKATEKLEKPEVNDTEEIELFGQVNSDKIQKSDSTNIETKSPKSPKKKSKGTKNETSETAQSSIKSPNFKTLQVNLPVLGQIQSINQYECVISLPNQLKGYVNFKNDGFTPGLSVNV